MIQFILNNEVIKTKVNAGITLLDFIREHCQLKGTKIGCREGDCGACTVLVGKLKNNKVFYESITSCISPLGNAHGKHIVTIEGINLPNKLNATQRAIADNFATQCGFCTPGFVVSMTGFALELNNNLKSCNDAISGNICRCTGYKSIEKAGLIIEGKLKGKDQKNLVDWLIKEDFIPDYFNGIEKKLEKLELKKIVSKEGQIVANGTDLYVKNADKLAEEEVVLISNYEELKGITFEDSICTMGANTTVTELFEHQKFNSFFPKLRSFFKLVSSEPIRNMGTLGGNIVNASPIGDMSIFFLALNANLTIQHKSKSERKLPLNSFFKSYKDFDLRKEEVVKSISFELPQNNDHFNFEKVSKRTHLDIASVNSAAKITMEKEIVKSSHISLGGVSPIPKYLLETSDFLQGKKLDPVNIKKAASIMMSEIEPISDIRGALEYKRLLARQLFFAHFIELFPKRVQLKNLLS